MECPESVPVTPAPSVMWEDLDGEIVIVDAATNDVHRLNPVGSLIWSSLAEGRTIPEVARELEDAFGGAPDSTRSATHGFVTELIDLGILIVRDQ